ncbi:MAG: hypothetical protein JNM62_00610 [Flavobacteriales bacterium]|nr:hypothetical protein [Flavobacteriales bacterium]
MKALRVLSAVLGLWSTSAVLAQPELPCELNTLPMWMQSVVSADKPLPYVLPKKEAVHTNAFIGRWSIQKEGGKRYDFWSDKQRIVIQEFKPDGGRKRSYFIDLAANIRITAITDKGEMAALVEDLYLPQFNYYREIWSDTVSATGRTETILDAPCKELRGTNRNSDTAYYWTTDTHSALFADMRVWSPWLRSEDDMEFLTALCSEPAGGSLRAQWPARKHSLAAGSIAFLSITPGATPMLTLEEKAKLVAERRFLWMNNSGIGILPAWMRAYVSPLKQDSLPAVYTPQPVKRNIPDNQFIGTFTAEKSAMMIGMRDQRTGSDTSVWQAKYSYWADARRAVLIMDDPLDEGYIFYAVDLDADVVMVARNKGRSSYMPKVEIASLETVGLQEFGRGLEGPFTSTGKKQTLLGRECELFTTDQRFINQFWVPKKETLNPIFDVKNWMVQRVGQWMKDLMLFGVADKPMPMQVMGTYLTSYKPGAAKPPVVDLTYCRVRDERLEQRRQRSISNEIPDVELPMVGTTVSDEPGDAPPDEPPMAIPEPPSGARGSSGSGGPGNGVGTGGMGTGNGTGGGSRTTKLSPELETVMARTTNQFIGSALLEYTLTASDGAKKTWTIRYASTSDRMVIIGRDTYPMSSEHTWAIRIDRPAEIRTTYHIKRDSSLIERQRKLDQPGTSFPIPAFPDSLTNERSKINGRWAIRGMREKDGERRTTWLDMKTPSLFLDILSAMKHWNESLPLLWGTWVTIANGGMPMEVDHTLAGGTHLVMRVLELKPGPVDPKMFEITKDSWTR